MEQSSANTIIEDVNDVLTTSDTIRSFAILALCLLAAYLLSRLLSMIIVAVAQSVAVRSDAASAEKAVQLRRVETYLSVALAVVRVVTIVGVGYVGWRVVSQDNSVNNLRVAAIGVGTVFAVIAGGTIIPLLRDITAGATMIAERWFNVGDFIRIEPFAEVGGVVERVTLRSTKIRSLNGEVIWVHNQHMQAVRTTPRGIRTLHIDVFVRDLKAGKALIERVSSTIPVSTMTVVSKIGIIREEQWGDKRWLLTVEGKTPPGREWLMETYFVESLKELDEEEKVSVLSRIPIVRYADPAAERSFKRAVKNR